MGRIGGVAFVTACLVGTASAAEWEDIKTDSKGVIYQIDRESIRSTPEMRSYWLRSRYPEPVRLARIGVPYVEVLQRMDVRCSDRQLRRVESIFYDEHGNVVADERPTLPEWRELVPDSNGEMQFKLLCGPTAVPDLNACGLEVLSAVQSRLMGRLAYPERARNLGQQGTVLLKVKIYAESAGEVFVEKSSGFVALDRAALEAAKVPASEARVSSKCMKGFVTGTLPIGFNLE